MNLHSPLLDRTMLTTRYTIPIALLLATITPVHAQQEAMVSQYMFNGLFINPAYAGSHHHASGSILHREQWTNVTGAPTTSTLAFDAPLMNNKFGLGFTMIHDQVGVTRELQADLSLAYRIRTSKYGRLAFALKGGVDMYSARLSELVYIDANDAAFQGDIQNEAVGKFGCGIYWSDQRNYIGFSVPTVYAMDQAIIRTSAFDHYFTRHYYLNAGRVFSTGRNIDLKPSMLVKYEPQAPVEVDVNCNVLFKKRFWLGAGYRTEEAVVGMLEYQMTRRLRLGYAYDLMISRLGPYSGGSHEAMLGFDFGRGSIKIKTPRYF